MTVDENMKSNKQAESSGAQELEEGALAANKAPSSRLSVISKQYDLHHRGKLDDTEQKMRDLDTEGRGYLSNSTVYEILEEQARTRSTLKKQRNLLIFFAILLIFLAAANIGIAFAAATLAKDTSVSSNNVLVVKESRKSVATNSHAELFDITTSQDAATNLVETTMAYSDAVTMYSSCVSGESVNLVRTWPQYRFNDFVTLCPAQSYPQSNPNVYTYIHANSMHLEINCGTGDGSDCTVTGNLLLQEVEQDCVYNEDCTTGNCFYESWIPEGDPGTCKCSGNLGCAAGETCVDNSCGSNQGGGNGNVGI